MPDFWRSFVITYHGFDLSLMICGLQQIWGSVLERCVSEINGVIARFHDEDAPELVVQESPHPYPHNCCMDGKVVLPGTFYFFDLMSSASSRQVVLLLLNGVMVIFKTTSRPGGQHGIANVEFAV